MTDYAKAAQLAKALDKLDAQEADEIKESPTLIRAKYEARRQKRAAKEDAAVREMALGMRGHLGTET